MALAVLPAMNGDRNLHPFFTKASHPSTNGSASGDERFERTQDATDAAQATEKPKRKRATKTAAPEDGKTQKTLREIVHPSSKVKPDEDGYAGTNLHNENTQEKRRRVSEDEFVSVNGHEEQGTPAATTPTRRRLASPQVIIEVSSDVPDTAPDNEGNAISPPKKMLRLNASGKFSSPVSKKPKEEATPEAPKRRGRPRKSKDAVVKSQLLVVFSYMQDSTVGATIDRILSGEERQATQASPSPKKKRTTRNMQPAKLTHPFFTGKSKDEEKPPKQPSPRKTSAVTPGKLRRQTQGETRFKQAAEPNDVWASTLGKDRLMMKHPGANDPAWPSQDSLHVRGLDEVDLKAGLQGSGLTQAARRKRKQAMKDLPIDESLLSRFASQMAVEEDGLLRPDGFQEPHPSLTVPNRLLISGDELASRVSAQLHCSLKDSTEDELASSSQTTAHPILQKLFDDIPGSLTAFDEGRGETLSWTQKYAPLTAAEVLQPSKEMAVLKDWLQSLTVTAVEGSSKPALKSVPKADVKPKKKRKRRSEEMDDFLVSDDEAVHDMDELIHSDITLSDHTQRRMVNSVVQVAADGVKLSNAVLLSGPHGCGKTAAAYAVAKELGFKIFEISSSERRSGKDVLERVGDMTENHLVKHHGVDPGETSSAEEPSRFEEVFQRDLASGRQGKMDGFFKPKAKAKPKAPKQPLATKAKHNAIEVLQKTLKKPAKDQQQSLILLEEVDILFKDDKEFWTTVLKLIATSKRPFIMTCNDEDMVPIQAMTMHAVLRFHPTPIKVATDYLLLVAAAEGHLVKREAVKSLYLCKNQDLRASIAELNIWCQMGVGDPKGGLSWIYQRYPPGSDVDDRGRRLRVVSEGTYHAGTNVSGMLSVDTDDRLMREWHESGLDPTITLGWHDISLQQFASPLSLKAYSTFANALSAADVYTGSPDSVDLDTTQMPPSDNTRSQYTEGMRLLSTPTIPDTTNFLASLATTTAILAHQTLGFPVPHQLHTHPITPQPLSRHSFAVFDPLTYGSDSSLTASAFDCPLPILTQDLAPYVRTIVRHDLALAAQREQEQMSRGGKAARTTRAARSAVDWGLRGSQRRDKWFHRIELDDRGLLATGGHGWGRFGTG